METIQKQTMIGSYLSFNLGDEIFAASVSKVINILEMCKVTQVPKTQDYMKGVINLRGTVLPLVDIRIKFGMPELAYTSNTCILVLEVNIDDQNIKVGAIVDSVSEVLEINNTNLQSSPSIGTKYESEFIQSIYRKDESEEFIMILDMDKIFSISEISVLKEHSDINQ